MQKTNKTYDINLTINTENIHNLYKKGRNPVVKPLTMIKIIVYAYIKGIYSSKKIENVCKRNLDLFGY